MATVRLATEADLPRILDLYRELTITTSLTEQTHRPSPDNYRRVFAEISTTPGHHLLIAEDQGDVVGTVVLVIVPNISHGALPWAQVENLVVDPKCRRRGLGRQLMEHAITRAREAGCYKLQLSSNKRRRGAHRFYGSLGFETSAHGFRRYF